MRPDVLIVPITTHPGPLRVRLPAASHATGLWSTSYARCETVGPLRKSHLKSRIGHLPDRGRPDVEADPER